MLGADARSDYRDDARGSTGKWPDVVALRVAARRSSGESSLAQVLRSGPIPGASEEIKAYAEVYLRGMEEIKGFLQQTVRG